MSWPNASINDAAEYYSHQQSDLGAAFIIEVQRRSESILQYPEAAPIVLGTTHRRLCHRFSYALLYTVRSGAVRILAVMNLRRRPGYWVGRS